MPKRGISQMDSLSLPSHDYDNEHGFTNSSSNTNSNTSSSNPHLLLNHQRLSSDQKKEILRIVETSLAASVPSLLSSSSTSSTSNVNVTAAAISDLHSMDLQNSSNNNGNSSNTLHDKLTAEQRSEILRLIEQGIEATGEDVTLSATLRPAISRGITITRSQKNELLLIIGQSLEELVDDGNKGKRKYYTKQQKDEMLTLTASCMEEGMSGNAAVRYLNTIPGYDKVTRKMIREWRNNRFPQQRGRKVSQEFENEVMTEIRAITGHDLLSRDCDAKSITYDEVRRAALNVRDRYYEGVGQKWMAHPKTKDLHFSSNWVRKVLMRNIPSRDGIPKPDNMMLDTLDTDSDEG